MCVEGGLLSDTPLCRCSLGVPVSFVFNWKEPRPVESVPIATPWQWLGSGRGAGGAARSVRVAFFRVPHGPRGLTWENPDCGLGVTGLFVTPVSQLQISSLRFGVPTMENLRRQYLVTSW